MPKRNSTRLGVDLRAARPSVELEAITKARAHAEQGGVVVRRISDGYRVTWAGGGVADYLDENINALVDDLYGSWSEVWGADLRAATHPEQSEAVRTVREQCERVGVPFRHRQKGWSVGARNYWPEEINHMVDEVEAYAVLTLRGAGDGAAGRT